MVEESRLSRPGSATGCWPCTTRVDRPRPSADTPASCRRRPAEGVLFSSVGTGLAEMCLAPHGPLYFGTSLTRNHGKHVKAR